MSAKNLAIAENLSPKHHFLMFTHQVLNSNGNPAYKPYNRFPIGSFALIKLAILPFGDDLSAKIYIARTLMLLCFASAAVLAYLSLRRLAANPWIALAATLLAFSSAYCLYYSDMISNEAVIDLFAVILVFHGMVIFEQEGQFRQLLLKTSAALLLGWHTYALLLPFIAFGLMRELHKAQSGVSAHHRALRRIKHTALSLMRSRYLTLGVVALLFGISILTFNFTNEYFALKRETPLTELPSFTSMLNRTGVDTFENDKYYSQYLRWPAFLERQLHRIGIMSLPYAFAPSFEAYSPEPPARLLAILGIAASGASLFGLLFVRRHKILLAVLALSGFCWALPMRYNTTFPHHNFESIFYIGVTLTLFYLALICLRRLSSEWLIVALAIATVPVFAASALRMSQLNNSDQTDEFYKAIIADSENIRNITDDGESIQIAYYAFGRDRRMTQYPHTGRIVTYIHTTEGLSATSAYPDFVITKTRIDGLASLTPQNRTLFLYEGDDFHSRIDEIIQQADGMIIQSEFDVYLNADALIYVKDDCDRDYTGDRFFLGLFPVNESDLPAERRQQGFDNWDFRFRDIDVRLGQRCIAIKPLPNYDIARIHTGQYRSLTDGSTQHLWEGETTLPNPGYGYHMRRIDEIIAQGGEPLIRSDFDIYLADNNLIYFKDDCGADDIGDKFFLAVYPADENVLSDDRRQYGYDDFSFQFQERGVQRGERCIAIVPLPEYAIDRIHTGQYIQLPDGSFEHLWGGLAKYLPAANKKHSSPPTTGYPRI